MSSHFLFLVLFAAIVSAVFAALQRDTPREQVRFGLALFAGFVAAAVVMSWLMLPLPFGRS
jgi:prepilin signal peptidase PulO-like enzyme (type II secretory pathway)